MIHRLTISSSGHKQDISACLVTPDSGTEETWIGLMGYRSWLNEFELGRFSLIANKIDRQLLILESPGMSAAAGRKLTPKERWQGLYGDYWSVGNALSTAAHRGLQTLGIGRSSVTGLIAYSMGTSLGVAALRAGLLGSTAPTVVLVEPAATLRRSPLHLAAAIKREDAPTSEYLENFHAWPGFAPFDKRPHEPRLSWDHMLLGFGLAWGKLPEQAASHPIDKLVVVRGTQSRMLSRTGTQTLLTRAGPARGVEVLVDGGHGMWHSLPHMSHLLDALAKVLL